MKSNISKHPCTNKCSNFKGEQCNTRLIPDSDFIAGDVVVYTDANKSDSLMTVHKVQGNGVLLDGNRNFALAHFVRAASVVELNAKRRLTAVELAVGEVS